jgi:hypothetical protein
VVTPAIPATRSPAAAILIVALNDFRMMMCPCR